MVKRALIILLLIGAPLIAGESGVTLSIRLEGQTYTYPLYKYPEDVQNTYSDPYAAFFVTGLPHYAYLKPGSSATPQEVVRLKAVSTYVNNIYTIGAASPYSINATPEQYFRAATFQVGPDSFRYSIWEYKISWGAPLNVVLPPRVNGWAIAAIHQGTFRETPITSIDWGGFKGFIETNAFRSTNLTSVTIPEYIDITEANGAFYACPNLVSMTINKPFGGRIPSNFAHGCPISNLILGPVNLGNTLEIISGAFLHTTRVTFQGPPERYYFYTGLPVVEAFQEAEKLHDAFTIGGAGTYAYNGSDWVKE